MIFLLNILAGIAASSVVNSTYSPDSSCTAFTSANDLYVARLSSGDTLRLTTDGSRDILNGYASWVYYEEIFGRPSRYRAFWWSPDSKKLAYYRFDESGMKVFPIFSPFGQYGRLNQTRYPKAGDANPSVKVCIYDVETGKTVTVFSGDSQTYYGTPFWGADSRELFVSVMPRRQNTLDLYAASAGDGAVCRVYHEEYPTWINWITGMLFDEQGLYMARDFETGWQQIYYLSYDGKTVRRLTDGENWDISLIKLNKRLNSLWFTAKRDDRLHPSLYRLDLRKGTVKLMTDPGMYVSGARVNDDDSFTAECSTASEPVIRVKSAPRRCAKPYVSDGTPAAPPADRPSPERVVIENDGFELYGLINYPDGFDPSKKYPVIMEVYGGPGNPYVRDYWNSRDASNRWCRENGIIYMVVDPRSSGENGRRGMDMAFRRMTVIELQDYIAWARYMQSLPYVDGRHIGVEGFSFGGTTTSMLVLRYPEYFRCGIAGGGVYDWTLYDSHYTERFMCTPGENPEGYKEASVLHYVREGLVSPDYIPGSLKLTHGTGDDNVHFQNTLLLADALQQAGIQFEFMVYPDGMHGYRGAQKLHSDEADHIFWKKNLFE